MSVADSLNRLGCGADPRVKLKVEPLNKKSQ